MSMLRTGLKFLVIVIAAWEVEAFAMEKGLGIGWHDPPNAQVGGNLFLFGDRMAMSMGIGSVDANGEKNDAGVAVSGDLDLKFWVGGQTFRPYLELGLLASGSVGSPKGIAFSAARPFGGGGLFIWGSKLFGYLGVDFAENMALEPMAGFGTRI